MRSVQISANPVDISPRNQPKTHPEVSPRSLPQTRPRGRESERRGLVMATIYNELTAIIFLSQSGAACSAKNRSIQSNTICAFENASFFQIRFLLKVLSVKCHD